MRNERELPDNYPVHPGYLYVIDGHVMRYNGVDPTTVGELKVSDDIRSFRNCDIAARNLWDEMV